MQGVWHRPGVPVSSVSHILDSDRSRRYEHHTITNMDCPLLFFNMTGCY